MLLLILYDKRALLTRCQLTVSSGPGLVHPVGEQADEIEEEFPFRHRNCFVSNFDEEAEALRGLEADTTADVGAKVGSPGGRTDFESFVAVVGEVNLRIDDKYYLVSVYAISNIIF